MYQQIVIAGGGQAAMQTVDTLRRKGFTGKLTLVGDEPWLPYQRPPLSKKYLAGALERERLLIRPAQFFAEHHVTAVSRAAGHGDRARASSTCGSMTARCCRTTRCVLATGSRPRRLHDSRRASSPGCTTCAPSPMPTASAPNAPPGGARA